MYVNIYKYVRVSVNICCVLCGYSAMYAEISKNMGTFICKYLKIFEYFFVFSEEKPNFAHR